MELQPPKFSVTTGSRTFLCFSKQHPERGDPRSRPPPRQPLRGGGSRTPPPGAGNGATADLSERPRGPGDEEEGGGRQRKAHRPPQPRCPHRRPAAPSLSPAVSSLALPLLAPLSPHAVPQPLPLLSAPAGRQQARHSPRPLLPSAVYHSGLPWPTGRRHLGPASPFPLPFTNRLSPGIHPLQKVIPRPFPIPFLPRGRAGPTPPLSGRSPSRAFLPLRELKGPDRWPHPPGRSRRKDPD